jgi:hypothetical protein
MKYKNRHNNAFEFSYNENGNIDWKGEFKYTRCGFDKVKGEEILLYIDPSGGPFIGVDTDMSLFGLEGTVKNFVDHGDYYEIVIDKNSL